jgi:hypothetical protein
MTAKEEANRIGNLFYDGSVFDYDKEGHLKQVSKAKERALICVDEIINIPSIQIGYLQGFSKNNKSTESYWREVKKEIIKL